MLSFRRDHRRAGFFFAGSEDATATDRELSRVTESVRVLWTVRRLDHEYQAAVQRVEHGGVELRIIRDGKLMFAESWSSEQGAVEESERYRELLVPSGPL